MCGCGKARRMCSVAELAENSCGQKQRAQELLRDRTAIRFFADTRYEHHRPVALPSCSVRGEPEATDRHLYAITLRQCLSVPPEGNLPELAGATSVRH